MKTLWLLLGFAALVIPVPAHADPSPEEETFIKVPNTVDVSSRQEDVELKNLPPGLVKLVTDPDEKKTVTGFTYDLNGDGKVEYFIYDRMGSGSGGPRYGVYAEIDGVWRPVVGFQGWLLALPAKKGWPKLISVGRGGGGVWSKTYYEFSRGSYHATLFELYDRGVILKEAPPKDQ